MSEIVVRIKRMTHNVRKKHVNILANLCINLYNVND